MLDGQLYKSLAALQETDKQLRHGINVARSTFTLIDLLAILANQRVDKNISYVN